MEQVKLTWYLLKDETFGGIPVEVLKISEGIVTFRVGLNPKTDISTRELSVSRFLHHFVIWEDCIIGKVLAKYLEEPVL